MTDIKLIVCDLDGTLLRDDKTVSSYTVSILEKCQNMGIKFAVATARSSFGVKKFEQILSPDIWIVDGGCYAFDNGKIIYSKPLSLLTGNAVLKELYSAEGVERISAESLTAYFTNRPIVENEYAQELLSLGASAIETDFAIPLTQQVHKITAEVPFEKAIKIASKIKGIDVLRYSNEKWVRFSDEKATKWYAIENVAEHLGIKTQNILAFGDDFNDILMLKNSGIGVAVENAIDEAKQAADYACKSNEDDGVASWVEERL